MAKSDRVLTLDVGTSRVVLAEFMAPRGEVPELLNYGIGYIDVQGETEMDTSAFVVSSIRDIMREHQIKPAPLLMTVSGQSVFPRFVKLPPVSEDKISQIVQYEAEQNVPFPINEVVWDYQLIHGGDGSDLSVMLVAVKTENVTRMTDCVTAAGLDPEIVDVAPMALYNCVRFNYPDIDGCTMVLDIGAKSSNLIFIEGDKIFSRSIPVAGFAITQEIMKEFEVSFSEAEQLKLAHGFVAFGGVYAGPDSEDADRVSKIVRNVVTRLHAEVNRSINFFRGQQGGSPPSLVLLTGGSCVIPHLDTFFREKLAVQVEYMNPFANISVGAGIDAEQAGRDIHMMGQISGLALRRSLECPVEINLMPPEMIARKTLQKRQPFFVMAAAGLVLIMLCWWVYFYNSKKMFDDRKTFIEERTSEITRVEGRLKDALRKKETVEARFSEIAEMVVRRTEMAEILESIHSCMKEGMWLSAIRAMTFDGQNVTDIEIMGKGFVDKFSEKPDETSVIEQFKNRLVEKGFFTENTKITQQPVPHPSDFAREFTIMLNLKKPIRIKDTLGGAQVED